MKPIRHVLCATDLLSTPRQVLDTAATLAKSARAPLTFVYVLGPPVVPPDRYLDAVTMDRLQTRARAWAVKALQTLSKRTSGAGIETTVLIRTGDAAEQIVRAGRATKADLIVMGTHGRKGLTRLLMGSVAQRVVSLAPCPVVTVRGR
jgi:nucleotide-binding universal stress UspA family protein